VPCLVVLIVLAMPRFAMVALWLFSDYMSRAFEGWLLPLLGFFLAPTTTLAYAVTENETLSLRGWGGLLMAVAILVDLGSFGRGRGAFRRN
jgi:hypothetical protein